MFLKKCAPPISGVKIKPTAELQTPNGPAQKTEEEKKKKKNNNKTDIFQQFRLFGLI